MTIFDGWLMTRGPHGENMPDLSAPCIVFWELNLWFWLMARGLWLWFRGHTMLESWIVNMKCWVWVGTIPSVTPTNPRQPEWQMKPIVQSSSEMTKLDFPCHTGEWGVVLRVPLRLSHRAPHSPTYFLQTEVLLREWAQCVHALVFKMPQLFSEQDEALFWVRWLS